MTKANIKKLYLDCDRDPDAINASLEIGVNAKNYIFFAVQYEDDHAGDARVIQLDHETAKALCSHFQDILSEFDNG